MDCVKISTVAGPVTHLVLADKVFNQYFANKDRKRFFIGTCFPDIRRLKIIERKRTHFSGLKLVDVQKEESFFAGLKFHSLVDWAQFFFVRETNGFPNDFRMEFKHFEDEVNYRQITNWSDYLDYLNEVLPEEIDFGLKEVDVQRWHRLLQEYLAAPPSDSSREGFLSTGLFQPNVPLGNQIIAQLRNNPAMVRLANEFLGSFEKILEKYF